MLMIRDGYQYLLLRTTSDYKLKLNEIKNKKEKGLYIQWKILKRKNDKNGILRS